MGDLTLTHGLPGKQGYHYARPFDYFDFHVTAVTGNTLESLTTRGLLAGTTYASGNHTRGLWGLFGGYDYISPQVFRSPAPPSLGTVGRRGSRTASRCRGPHWAAQDMVRPAAFNAERNETITTA